MEASSPKLVSGKTTAEKRRRSMQAANCRRARDFPCHGHDKAHAAANGFLSGPCEFVAGTAAARASLTEPCLSMHENINDWKHAQ
jgi:hypothetical protein